MVCDWESRRSEEETEMLDVTGRQLQKLAFPRDLSSKYFICIHFCFITCFYLKAESEMSGLHRPVSRLSLLKVIVE